MTACRLWVRRRLCCAVCAKQGKRIGWPDPHHLHARKHGGRRRDEEQLDVDNVVPLCRIHHSEFHALGALTAAERWKLNLEQVARDVWQHWLRLPEEERRYYEAVAAGEPIMG